MARGALPGREGGRPGSSGDFSEPFRARLRRIMGVDGDLDEGLLKGFVGGAQHENTCACETAPDASVLVTGCSLHPSGAQQRPEAPCIGFSSLVSILSDFPYVLDLVFAPMQLAAALHCLYYCVLS